MAVALSLAATFTASAFDVPMTFDPSGATKTVIPMADDATMDCSTGIIAKIPGVTKRDGNVNDGGNIGSTAYGTNIYYYIDNKEENFYRLSFKTGTQQDPGILKVMIIDANGYVYLDENEAFETTGSWAPVQEHELFTAKMPAGTYRLSLTVTDCSSSYAGNWGQFRFDIMGSYVDKTVHIPGTLGVKDYDPFGACRKDANTGELSYVQNGGGITMDVIVDEAGVYTLSMPTQYISGGQVNIVVTDKVTGKVEANTTCVMPSDVNTSDKPAVYLIDSTISEGKKNVKLTFLNNGGFVCNAFAPTFEKVAEKIARLDGFDVPGQTVESHALYDWNVTLPIDFAGETLKFNAPVENGTLTIKALKGSDEIPVTDLGNGAYSIPAPAQNDEIILTMTVNKEDDPATMIDKSVWTARLYRIGDIIITGLTLDNQAVAPEIIEALNADAASASISDFIFTSIPALKASFLDGSSATATGTLNGDAITYKFQGKVSGKQKDYTLTAKTAHIWNRPADAETVELKWSSAGPDGNWTNGSYTLQGVNDGYQSSYKIGMGEKTLVIPSDVIVKQLVFRELRNNYDGNNGHISSVTSGDAVIYHPTLNGFEHGNIRIIDGLYVNFENHTAGQPIKITVEGGGQMMCWIELVIEHKTLNTPPMAQKLTVSDTNGVNHFVVKAEFDREIKSAEAIVGTTKIPAVGAGSSVLYFPVWNLDYAADYIFTIPAGSVEDLYGNKNDQDFSVNVTLTPKTEVEKKDVDYIVSNVDEFKAALAAVNASNKTADAPAAIILVKNGDYDFGSEEQTFRTYNVSVIGESRDGVILHGRRDGISNPVISTRNATDTYLQDLTLRNDLDFDSSSRNGVGVALYSGRREIGVNLSLQSQQDTQVTGEEGYYTGCDIYGSVDFICGGGDIFYDNCHLFITNDGYISAPMTSTTNSWGYVFSNCTVDGYKGSYTYNKHGGYALGRPWSNEPRAYFLNTKMNLLASATGWGPMSDLPTHFYEYGSTDANGNLIDLSTRKNSPTHVGDPYTPVLTAQEAARFTVENVLGSTTSYLPTESAAPAEAPVVTTAVVSRAATPALSWKHNPDARYYAVFKDGRLLTTTTDNTYTPDEDGSYTVKAANARGGLGEASNEILYSVTSVGTIQVAEPAAIEYYNLQGIRVAADSEGILVKVTIDSEGNRNVIKVIK